MTCLEERAKKQQCSLAYLNNRLCPSFGKCLVELEVKDRISIGHYKTSTEMRWVPNTEKEVTIDLDKL